MVKAELSYNPYLQETEIKFNGQSPRINSHVEKYLDKKLQVWIKKLPYIFRDEMNGYGFELEFTGTRLDCEELKKAFADAGVSEAQVRIFHKNELDDRDSKIEKLEMLLNWLEENPNDRYDFEKKRREHYELFDGDYEFIVLHGRITDTEALKARHISIENVENIEELTSTDLHNIPILYVVDPESVQILKNDLRILEGRPDVVPDQIFFLISPNLHEETIVREIMDLGITEPNIVRSATDPIIMKFFELFPFTDYIRDSLRLFKKDIPEIRQELDIAISETKEQNIEQHNQIDKLDAEINCLKESLDKFINPDRTDFSVSFLMTIEETKNKILNWRKQKTKITQPNEAVRIAVEFDRDVQDYYQEYLRKMHSALVRAANTVQIQQRGWYDLAFADRGFVPQRVPVPDFTFDAIPSMKDTLLEIREEAYVTPKDDFLGWFFKQNPASDPEPILEITYYYAKWREYALSTIEPYLYNIFTICVEKLNDYFDSLGNAYKEYLLLLLAAKEADKANLSSQLSEEEQLLQSDNDWLVKFTDMVKMIERD